MTETRLRNLIDDLQSGSFGERHNIYEDACDLFAQELSALLSEPQAAQEPWTMP